jgi:hypothetical protein
MVLLTSPGPLCRAASLVSSVSSDRTQASDPPSNAKIQTSLFSRRNLLRKNAEHSKAVMGAITEQQGSSKNLAEGQSKSVALVRWGSAAPVITPSHIVPQFAREIGIDEHALDSWESSRCQFGADLPRERILAPALEKARQDKGGGTFPDPGALRRAQQVFNTEAQVRRQLPQNLQVAVANHCDLNFAGAPLRPRSSKVPDRSLSVSAQSPSGVNNDVVEMAVAVQIHGDCVGVLVVIAKRSSVFIFTGQFWTVD